MASGDTMAVFNALQGMAPEDNWATLSWLLGTSADEPDQLRPVLAFDATADEHIDFIGVLSNRYAGGGLTVELVWTSAATTGNCIWGAQFLRWQDGTDNFLSSPSASAQTVTAATSGSARTVDYDSITFTDGAQMDSLAAGEAFSLRIYRDADNASDTINSNDCELIAVHIQET